MTQPVDLTEAARAILRANDRGGYSVPTARLYPFQWNWDSGFVAMGWATFDESRAWAELETLLKGQWEDGLVPQIVFHAPSEDYFPGPDVWGTARSPQTSGITQPPILATAARRIFDRSRAPELAAAKMAEIFPRLLASHRWWERARDPARTGLVATLHPWETGMDNSPAWDAALGRVPTATRTTIRRRDTSHVDAALRPHMEDYQRFIHLVEVFRDAEWQPARMLAASPFRVADIGTNAILLRAEQDLLTLARRFGTDNERIEILARVERLQAGIQRLWSPAENFFLSHDLLAGEPIAARTSAGFLPLFARAVMPRQRLALIDSLQEWRSELAFLVPSTDPHDSRFEPRRYWRGPIWAVVNWMIAEGLRDAGESAAAEQVGDAVLGLIGKAGFSEYFDPTDGTGLGGADFSWTAAIWLLLKA